MTDITEALVSLCPGRNWELHGYSYDGLIWKDEEMPKPTEEEINQKMEELNAEKPWIALRKERDKRLAETDKYTSIPDWPHPSEEAKQVWLDYRQALRDLPANTTDPENPVWPQAPTP